MRVPVLDEQIVHPIALADGGGNTLRQLGLQRPLHTGLPGHRAIEIAVELHARLRRQVVGTALAIVVHRQRGLPGIEILHIARQHLRSLEVDALAKLGQLIALMPQQMVAAGLHVVKLPIIQPVDLLGAYAVDAHQPIAGAVAQKAEVIFIHNAAPVGAHQRAALGDKAAQLLGNAAAQQVKHGGDDQLVAGKAALHVDDIGRDPQLPQRAIVLHTGLQIVLAAVARPGRPIDRPAVFGVEDERRLRLHAGAAEHIEPRQPLADRLHILKHPRIAAAVVRHDGAMELLKAAAALAPLEILHRIRAMRHRLHAGEHMHAGALELADPLPVGHARGALHQHEGLLGLQRADPVMDKGRAAGDSGIVLLAMPGGIGVPGGEIHRVLKLPIVEPVEGVHHVDRYRQIGAARADGLLLMEHKIVCLVGDKALPVERQPMHTVLALRIGRVDLLKVRIAAAPEGGPPGGVQLIDGAIFLPQKVAEGGGAQRAIALPAKFVADVPGDHARMAPQPLGKHFVQLIDLAAVDGRGIAVVVPAIRLIAHLVAGQAAHLGIFAGQPDGDSAARRCQHGIDAVLIEALHRLLEPLKVVFPLLRL